MKFSTRARYGLRAMIELAINYNPHTPITLKCISEKQGIPEGYLEQLMTLLRRRSLVRSIRGPQGGYLLTRNPCEITAGDVVRCLDGPLSPTNCASEVDPVICMHLEQCVTNNLWNRIRIAVANELDNTTLKDLCEDLNNLQNKDPEKI